MKITIAQINTKVGDIAQNEAKIKEIINEYGKQSDVISFPELTTTGYPPNDLLENEEFVREQKQTIYTVRDLVKQVNSQLQVVLGFVDFEETSQTPSGQFKMFNAGAIVGQDIKIYHKKLLPNYDIFFEKRYFSKGKDTIYFRFANQLLGTLTICEDIWDENYRNKPIQEILNPNINSIFNISSSPFIVGKQETRYQLILRHLNQKKANYIYTNQVGAQDEVIFDGTSMIFDNNGVLIHLSNSFEEDISTIDMSKQIDKDKATQLLKLSRDKYGNIIKALGLGLRDYLDKSGIKKVVIGISGGIDSAISAFILSQNIPKESINAIYMPSKHSNSLKYAQKLCNGLGIKLIVGEINGLVNEFQNFSRNNLGGELIGISYENIQARIRGNILMSIANNINGLVINNSNKTELALGYGTLYGDLIGGLSLIGDLNKKEIYELARYINQNYPNNPIPQDIIQRPASAELNDGQIDPFDYMKISDAVDEILWGASNEQIKAKYGLNETDISKLQRLIKINEYKRRQSPPVLKLKHSSIGIGRLMPIV